MQNLRIDGDRLWASLMEMARIGATRKGGVNRQALTELDGKGRDLFVQWCQEAGCSVRVDAVGNIFARRPGRDDSLAPVMTGSHLDTQPTGGKWDGVFGVLSGLEVLRTLNDFNYETERPVEVSVWTNEEGCRFAPAMMGSGVAVGKFDLDEIYAKTDAEGNSFRDELQAIGYLGPEPAKVAEVAAFFETHIEQGPILEDEEKTIGIVQGAQGQRWFDVTLTGQEAHAGPTPMKVRRDALVGAAAVVAAVNRVGHDFQPGACATVGQFDVSPNSRNTIPGSVTFSVDFRHPVDDRLSAMKAELETAAKEAAEANGLELDLREIWYQPPIVFDADCVAAVQQGAETVGLSAMEIVSGAGHDACHISELAPTGMIFVPCKDGISHNEVESATKEDCAAGCNVLLHALIERANAV
ncbi:MAG: Zn-dependent hydrolase [Alphaproteobacteria bacterium]|jgi:N-carbamoyl-L-amino-acid hydrolase|nr:Zn-dependent hydrolase [Alphaproteobacteria bacterium]MDP6816203.1 Zn-dependent hydrolase [Alphaproteobacteria bacterium]